MRTGKIAKYPHYLGFTLIELLVSIATAFVLLVLAAFNFKQLENKTLNTANGVVGFLKVVRARALTNSLAYEVAPVSLQLLRARAKKSCVADQYLDDFYDYELREGVIIDNPNWNTCYSARGMASQAVNFKVTDGSNSRVVEVVLGGAVRQFAE
ncbi:MAG TPA: prepilin-type N-terminal cleavage/methylation domain-containing protein [Oligoflexia bacterium]|nr:prepilin-type N-terminal cleavage/methylation domain-containing protein [Oligoflexia bacterium]HMP26524.1 prepilin-type N-terminal cleavage/methylation domain-containing protein [Oligoflexia bacterium]